MHYTDSTLTVVQDLGFTSLQGSYTEVSFRMYSSLRTSVTPLNEEASLGILKHLNKDELSKLLDDDGKLVELIKDDQQVSLYVCMHAYVVCVVCTVHTQYGQSMLIMCLMFLINLNHIRKGCILNAHTLLTCHHFHVILATNIVIYSME